MPQKSILQTYVMKKKGLLGVSGILSVLSTLSQFIPFYCIYKIIELLVTKEAASAQMLQWSLYSLASVLISMVLLYISSMCSHVAAFNILYEIRMDLIQHLSTVPMGYYTQHASGQMMKTIEQSVEKIESFVAHQIPDLVSAIFFPIIYIIVMVSIDWRLAIVSLIPIIVAIIIYVMLMGKNMKTNMVAKYHDALETMNSNGVEYIRAMPAVKIFGLSVDNFKRFYDSIQNYRTLVYAWAIEFKKGYVIFSTLVTSAVLFVMPFGVFLVSQDPQNKALALTVMLFIILSSGTNAPFMKLMHAASTFSNVAEGAKRIDEMFAVKSVLQAQQPMQPSAYDIRFEHVSFAYNQGVDVLKDVSFNLHENTINALVGPSGGGKSTIAQLLLRFYDVPKGNIFIGGVDIKNMSIDALMKCVSFVFQDVTLFNDTIEENIKMGNQSATTEDVISVAKMARCHQFIEQLPQGYQTKIGEHGQHLSKGEAQRISIARALLKNAPILVLDEATAYADAENEIYIQQALNELIKGKTVLIIAHRLWTIRAADQILVCDQGSIVASGTHDDLLDSCELYHRLWNINTATKEWRVKEHA